MLVALAVSTRLPTLGLPCIVRGPLASTPAFSPSLMPPPSSAAGESNRHTHLTFFVLVREPSALCPAVWHLGPSRSWPCPAPLCSHAWAGPPGAPRTGPCL